MSSLEGRTMLAVRVQRKTRLAEDIAGLELVQPEGAPLPGFTPGAHIDAALPNGLVRQYSLYNDAAQSAVYKIGVLRDPASRGGSASVHDDVNEGDEIRISLPRNHFPLHPAKRTLLLAGGIGVTPLFCMAQALAQEGAAFTLHYGARTASRMAFIDELRGAGFADQVWFHFDDGAPAQKLDAAALLATPEADTHLYVCGPKGFMDHVIGTARAQGWDEANIHFEYFGAAPSTAAAGGFELLLARSGRLISVAPEQSAAQALLAHGVKLPLSCEQGICGTCAVKVLEGVPDHRDLYLSAATKAANTSFTPCCSRAKSARLVIDL